MPDDTDIRRFFTHFRKTCRENSSQFVRFISLRTEAADTGATCPKSVQWLLEKRIAISARVHCAAIVPYLPRSSSLERQNTQVAWSAITTHILRFHLINIRAEENICFEWYEPWCCGSLSLKHNTGYLSGSGFLKNYKLKTWPTQYALTQTKAFYLKLTNISLMTVPRDSYKLKNRSKSDCKNQHKSCN